MNKDRPTLIAALPMYDWPEVRGEVDAIWTSVRDALRTSGIPAPERLLRAPSDAPSELDWRDDNDLLTLWRYPSLLFSQTCWGPLRDTDIAEHVLVLGQSDYSDVAGGHGTNYSSAIVMPSSLLGEWIDVPPPVDGSALLPLELIADKRFIGNDPHSLSGFLGMKDDLAAAGVSYDHFLQVTFSGGHRLSIRAIAHGEADVATIDCRSWELARRFEPAAAALRVVGWTAAKPGLPYVMARGLAERYGCAVRDVLSSTRLISPV